MPQLTLHGGAWYTAGKTRAIAGIEMTIFNIATLMVEHIAGAGGSSWIGLDVEIPKTNGLNIGLSVGIPNRPSEGVQHSLYATYTFRF